MLINLSNHDETETEVKDAFEIRSASDVPFIRPPGEDLVQGRTIRRRPRQPHPSKAAHVKCLRVNKPSRALLARQLGARQRMWHTNALTQTGWRRGGVGILLMKSWGVVATRLR